MSATPDTPPAPQGSRAEQFFIALLLALDLLSTPFHFLAFAFTRRRQVRALTRALQESAR